MQLDAEEQAILNGAQGEALSKVMKTLVAYGDIFEADRLVPVTHQGHLVTSFGISIMSATFSLMQELIDAGVKAKLPFTVDPRPIDNANVPSSLLQKIVAHFMYGKQKFYEGQLESLGLKSKQAFTCACYLDEVGNTPKKGDILSWAESSAVVYANSVLGARCNRNSAFIDLFGCILGKVPNFGLLTDEGRKATWIIEVKTAQKPEAQILGSAIGMKVVEDVPYIKGLDKFLGQLDEAAHAYLKDFGAATASNGAVGLYHVEGITPEAVELKEKLLVESPNYYLIDDAELARIKESYPVIWKNRAARPKLAFIGCPHLSLSQLREWTTRLEQALTRSGRSKPAVPVVFCSTPNTIELFKQEAEYARLMRTGAKLTHICPLMYMNNPLCKSLPVVTCSNKLRTYTSARYHTEAELLDLVAGVPASSASQKGGR